MQKQNIDIDMKVKLIHGFSNKTRIQILESIKDQEKTVSQIVEETKGKSVEHFTAPCMFKRLWNYRGEK